EDEIHVGDVFRVGGALVEVTQPRVPCYKLGIRMGLPQFVKMFLASCQVGFYLRVLEEGEVGAGDVFDRVRTDPERMTVREMGRLLYFDPENLAEAKRLFASGHCLRDSDDHSWSGWPKPDPRLSSVQNPKRGERAVSNEGNPTVRRSS
ncbi:MAG: MOSC domain-containing protein, partial [Actinomycetota bacterium]|nr:MOSC domain-containing protein [Actinomycetota bacterium]